MAGILETPCGEPAKIGRTGAAASCRSFRRTGDQGRTYALCPASWSRATSHLSRGADSHLEEVMRPGAHNRERLSQIRTLQRQSTDGSTRHSVLFKGTLQFPIPELGSLEDTV